jgi:hypothetical protein
MGVPVTGMSDEEKATYRATWVVLKGWRAVTGKVQSCAVEVIDVATAGKNRGA